MSRRQITASKSALLLQCPRPFEDGVEWEDREPGEAAQYGTRWHREMAAVLSAHDAMGEGTVRALQSEDDSYVGEHVMRAYDALLRWMRPDGNPFGFEFRIAAVEKSRGLTIGNYVDGNYVDRCDATLDEATHTYQSDSGWAPQMWGTADLVLEEIVGVNRGLKAPFRVVLDHKTGEGLTEDYSRPSQLAQLQALGIMFDADAVAVLHAPRQAPVVIYAEMRRHDEAVGDFHRALEMVGSGFMRVGTECGRCPARPTCPTAHAEFMAQTSALATAVLDGGPITRWEAPQKGRVHMLLPRLEAMAKIMREKLRADVVAGEVIERPDGKRLEISTTRIERFRKAKLTEAQLAELRACGALEMCDEERMVAK